MATRLVRNPAAPLNLAGPVIAAIGNFDGVHLGHQALIQRMSEARAGKGSSVLVSFYPHPAQVLGRGGAVEDISSLRQKLELLSGTGVDALVLIRFTEKFSRLRAAEFIEQYLFRLLGVNHIVLGPDAGIGFRREGNTDYIQEYFAKSGRTSEVLNFTQAGGERISSRRVRTCILDGDVAQARALMGHEFALDGHVVHGDGRGAGIGFRTANLTEHGQILPGNGVYATRSTVRGRTYSSVTNVGRRPTFGGEKICVETHLLDYAGGEFYRSKMRVSFVERLRGEVKFAGAAELVTQIKADVRRAREILS